MAKEQGWPRWSIWLLGLLVIGLIFLPSLFNTDEGDSISYGEFLAKLEDGKVEEATYNNTNGKITGELEDGSKFHTTGPLEPSEIDNALLSEQGVEFTTPETSIWAAYLPMIIIFGLLICSSSGSSAGPRAR